MYKSLKIVALSLFIACLTIFTSACKKEEEFKLEFIVNGEVYETIILDGSEYTMPEDPEIEGMFFDGWYTDNIFFAMQFDIRTLTNSTITSDIRVYAKFIQLSNPSDPVDPENPVVPEDPTTPSDPVVPENPVEPETPSDPIIPENPVVKYTVSLDSNMDSVEVEENKNFTLPIPTKTDYTFMGWYKGSKQITDYNGNSLAVYSYDQNISLTAKWQQFKLTVKVADNYEDRGRVDTPIDNKPIVANTTVRIKASPLVEAYSFKGWFKGSTCISEEAEYDFVMPYENITLNAKFEYARVNVNVHADTTYPDAGTVDEKNNAKIVYGERVYLNATTKNNYTFLGWYRNGELALETETGYVYVHQDTDFVAKWADIRLSVAKSISSAGILYQSYVNSGNIISSYNQRIQKGKTATFIAETSKGFTWHGWFKNDTLITKDFSYTHTVSDVSENIVAKWTACNVTLTTNNSAGGTVSGVDTTVINEKATIIATPKVGYLWQGWYVNGSKISEDKEYEITITNEPISYQACWELCTNHTYSNCYCACGVDKHNPEIYCIHEDMNLVCFGSYPQTLEKDEEIINLLKGKSITWKNFNYLSNYSFLTAKDYNVTMWRGDVSLGTDKYLAIKLTAYRPYSSSLDENIYGDSSSQDDYGYEINKIYFFKYEPIKWTIIEENNGRYLLMANDILDAQQYQQMYYYRSSSQAYINTSKTHGGDDAGQISMLSWNDSTLKEYLHDFFITKAFDDNEQKYLHNQYTEDGDDANNMFVSTEGQDSKYFSKVFIPTEQTLSPLSINLQRKATDFAKVQGLRERWQYTYNGYSGGESYILRESSTTPQKETHSVDEDGKIKTESTSTYQYIRGIVPMVVLNTKIS